HEWRDFVLRHLFACYVTGTEGHGPDSVVLFDVLALVGHFADARAGGKEVVQVVRERVELVVGDAVEADEEVVRQHRRDRGEQTEGGHDQRLAHRAGDGVDGGLAGGADADQGAVDAPHRTQQTDERRGRADGGQHGQARLEAHGLAGHGLAQGAVDELGAVQRLGQAGTVMALVVRGGLGGVERDLGERLAARLLFHVADRVLRVRGLPERADHAIGAAAQAHVLEDVDDDPVDRHRGHDEEGEKDDPGDGKAARIGHHFLEQMGHAHLRQGRSSVASGCSGGLSGFLQHDAYLWMLWFGMFTAVERDAGDFAAPVFGSCYWMTKSTGTRTRPPTFRPPLEPGLKRQPRAALIAARSRLRLPLDVSTWTSVAFPSASTLMMSTTVPWMPRRRSAAG